MPWSIARATQFHPLINAMLQQAAGWPVMMLTTDLLFQPVHPANVADYLCMRVSQGPAGRLPDFGGPEVLKLGNMTRTWLEIRGISKPIWSVPLPGKTAKSLRQGGLTCPQEKLGTITWAEWVRQMYEIPAKDTTVTTQG